MKTTQHAKSGVKKLPKAKAPARVMVLCDDEMWYYEKAPAKYRKVQKFAVIPTATAKQAKAIASFFNLSEDGQVEALAKELAPDCGKWAGECARAVLRRIKERR